MPEVTIAPQSSPPWGRLPAGIALVLVALLSRESQALSPDSRHPLPASPAWQRQQRTTLKADLSFYTEPNGTLLGTLRRGASVVYGRARGAWRQVTIEGWIFTRSVGPSPRPEFTLAVRADGGENVRNRPDGDQIARAVEGTGFMRLAREGGWTRVRRTAWVHQPQEARTVQAPPPPPPQPAPAQPPPAQPAPVQAPATPPSATPVERVIVRKGAPLAVGPGGAELGPAPEEIRGEVTGRAGNWVRIRTETWARADDLRPAPNDSAVTLDRLRSEADKLVGQPVTWRLQFLSIQRADELRPELPPGRSYLLTRGPLPEVGFVYVVVTSEQLQRFRAMNPLDEFVAHGRIRASRTRHLPTPVIELER